MLNRLQDRLDRLDRRVLRTDPRNRGRSHLDRRDWLTFAAVFVVMMGVVVVLQLLLPERAGGYIVAGSALVALSIVNVLVIRRHASSNNARES